MSQPVLNEAFDNTIIIDGLPIVDDAKASKLVEFVKKKFAEFEPISVELPMDDGKSHGFMFMELSSPEKAKAALSMTGKNMDKSHVFKVDSFSTPDQYENVPDVYVPLNMEQASRKPLPYMQDYLLDPAFRDQLLLRFDDETNTAQTHIDFVDEKTDDILVPLYTAADMLAQGKSLTQSHAGFSPKGTFMYTHHAQGIALWGGANFARIGSINHPNVLEVAFSPCERWMVTMSEQPNPSVLCDVVVWDTATQQALIRYNTILKRTPWPVLKWSYDGRYFGRTANRKVDNADGTSTFTPIGIAIYDTEKREVVGGKPLPAPSLVDFEFSPTGPELAYCILAHNNMPSRLVIYDVEKRRELRNNPTFGIERFEMAWQASGEHLLVYMDRKTDKRITAHALDVYFIKKKGIPLVEVMLPKPAARLQFSPTSNKILVTSFKINEKGSSKAEYALFNFDETSIHPIWNETIPFPSNIPTSDPAAMLAAFPTLWSPQGQTFLIATISNHANIMVMDASKDHVDILASDLQLAHGNSIKWDHDGRYFTIAHIKPYPNKNLKSIKDDVQSRVPSRVQLYTFQGQLLVDHKVQRLYNVEFRPYPVNHLTKEEQTKIKATLRQEYWKKFENADDRYEKSKLSGVSQHRNELKQKWKEMKQRMAKAYKQSEQDRREMYGGWCSDDEDEYETVVLSTVEKVIR